MTENLFAAVRKEFIPRNRRLATDPPAEWVAGKLYINVPRSDHVALSEEDQKLVQALHIKKNLSVEAIANQLRLERAAQQIYNNLVASGNLPAHPLEGVRISGNQVRILVTDQEIESIALGAEDRTLASINWPHLPEREARRRQLRTKAARKKFIQLVSTQHLPLTAIFEGEVKNLEDSAAVA